jgi:hypothetical protein
MIVNFKDALNTSVQAAIESVSEDTRAKVLEIERRFDKDNEDIDGVFVNDGSDPGFYEFDALKVNDVVRFDDKYYILKHEDAVLLSSLVREIVELHPQTRGRRHVRASQSGEVNSGLADATGGCRVRKPAKHLAGKARQTPTQEHPR